MDHIRETAEGADTSGDRGWRRRVAARVNDFVDRHIMTEVDTSGYEVRSSGWPAGIRPDYMTHDQLEKTLDDAFTNHWEAAQASLRKTEIPE